MIRPHKGDVLLDLLVQPRASRERVGPVAGDRLKVAVTAPPVDGKANRAVVELVARTLSMPRRRVELVSGEGSRRKTVRVLGARPADVTAVLAGLVALTGRARTGG